MSVFKSFCIVLLFLQALILQGQIYGPNALDSMSTNYSNGSPNDKIYMYCSPVSNGNQSFGELFAFSPNGPGIITLNGLYMTKVYIHMRHTK